MELFYDAFFKYIIDILGSYLDWPIFDRDARVHVAQCLEQQLAQSCADRISKLIQPNLHSVMETNLQKNQRPVFKQTMLSGALVASK